MSVNERAKKRKRRRNFKIFLVLSIILYMFIRIIPTLYASNLRTQTIEKGIIEDSISTKGIIIKNETVYTSQGHGKVQIIIPEGERVGAFTEILELDIKDQSSQLEMRLANIESYLEDVKKQDEHKIQFTSDINKNNMQISALINQIRSNLINKNYKEFDKLKNELKVIIAKQNLISGNNTLLNDTIKNLEEERKEIMSQIKKNSIIYYSDTSGLVSYNMDGLEKIYNAKNIMSYKANDFRVIDPVTSRIDDGGNVKFGQPLFKIIDNYEWYVMVKVPNDSIQSLKNGQDVLLELENNESIKSKIVNINNNEEETLIVLKSSDYLFKFYNERYVDVRIIVNKHEGLKIPSTSIIKKDGIEGVYIKDISGIVKFRPINVLAKNEEYAIVEEGNVYGYIDIEKNGDSIRKKTIKLYDEVFINANNLKEGQIINSL